MRSPATITSVDRRRIAWIAVVVTAFLAVTAVAGQPDAERRAAAIAHEIMSPYCPQLLLADCRSQPAVELRAEIAAALDRGVSEDAVRGELVRRFGERILAAPRTAGFGLFAWLTPPLTLAGAALLLVRRIRSSKSAAPPPEPTLPVADGLRPRLEDELRTM